MNESLVVASPQPVRIMERVYDSLVRAIMQAKLPPGQRLQPDRLARMIGVSPTPVKQALVRLVAEGLVTIRDGRYFITPISEEDVMECFEGRLFCELYAVEKGLPSGSEEHFARIARFNEEQAVLRLSSAPWAEIIAKDREFHRAIVALAGNSRLSAWHESLDTFMNVFRLIMIDPAGGAAPAAMVNEEHRRIMDAILARDVGAAHAALRHHIDCACERARERVRRAEAQRAAMERLD